MLKAARKRLKVERKISLLDRKIQYREFWEGAFNATVETKPDGVGGHRRVIHYKQKEWALYFEATKSLDGYDAYFFRSVSDDGEESEIKLSKEALRKVLNGRADKEYVRLMEEAKAELKSLKKKHKKMKKHPILELILDLCES